MGDNESLEESFLNMKQLCSCGNIEDTQLQIEQKTAYNFNVY